MKKIISTVEYAIAELAKDNAFLKKHRPRTREEEVQFRIDKIKDQSEKLKIKSK